MRRIIREEEPPKPSTRISTLGGKLTAISAHRHTDPKKLGQLVRGELDWIVMKALEKDRRRRYETASAFAADVLRHLGDQAVEACPPSAAYRLRKFARRNKMTLVGAGIVLLFLVLVGSGIGWGIRDRAARSAESAGRRAKVAAQVDLILSEVQRLEGAQRWDEALTTARSAEAALSVGESDVETRERVRQTLADLELIRRLEEIRARVGALWNDTSRRSESVFVQADLDYAAAFREAGIDIDRLPASAAADRMRLRPNIAPALLAVIDDWINVRATERDEPAMRKLRDAAQAADGDPWRGRLRDALLPRDFAAGEALAASNNLEQQSAATLSLLAQVLQVSQ
jgi:hypothetical protein